MILDLLNLFAMYTLVGMVLSVMVKILPVSFRTAFDTIRTFRESVSNLVLSIYKSDKNMEVNILAIFVVPFVVLILLFASVQAFIFSFPQYAAINIFLYIFIAFIFVSIVPSPRDLLLFRSQKPLSVLIFLIKVAAVIQLALGRYELSAELMVYFDLIVLIVVITPISPYFSSGSTPAMDSITAMKLGN